MKINLKNWMSNINDDADVLRLNIPGTHDVVTKYIFLSRFARCQDLDVYSQLNLGIRALDIRAKNRGDNLGMVHGICNARLNKSIFSKRMNMDFVLNSIYKFLDENESETVIFQFKNDMGKEPEKSFDTLLNTYIKKNKKYWYTKNKPPKMAEVRGKIVLIRRCKMDEKYNDNIDEMGIDFSQWVEQPELVPTPNVLETKGEGNAVFVIQDRYKYKPIPRWNTVIEPFLQSAKPFDGKYIIDYLSTAGGLLGPFENAKHINSEFLKFPLNKNNYYGTVYMDFPSEQLTKKVIELNF